MYLLCFTKMDERQTVCGGLLRVFSPFFSWGKFDQWHKTSKQNLSPVRLYIQYSKLPLEPFPFRSAPQRAKSSGPDLTGVLPSLAGWEAEQEAWFAQWRKLERVCECHTGWFWYGCAPATYSSCCMVYCTSHHPYVITQIIHGRSARLLVHMIYKIQQICLLLVWFSFS